MPPGMGPEGKPGNPSGQKAPAGPWPGADNPVVEKSPSPFTTGGYRADPSQAPLPRDPNDGYTRPPSGGRR
jgi:hypothetical protein